MALRGETWVEGSVRLYWPLTPSGHANGQESYFQNWLHAFVQPRYC
jgi:hypothetical protein